MHLGYSIRQRYEGVIHRAGDLVACVLNQGRDALVLPELVPDWQQLNEEADQLLLCFGPAGKRRAKHNIVSIGQSSQGGGEKAR